MCVLLEKLQNVRSWGRAAVPLPAVKKTLSFRTRKILLSRYLTILETMIQSYFQIVSSPVSRSLCSAWGWKFKKQEVVSIAKVECYRKKDYHPIHGEIKEKKREAQSTNFRFSWRGGLLYYILIQSPEPPLPNLTVGALTRGTGDSQ